MIFVDASAMIAMIADEPERTALAEKLADNDERIWSAMSQWETISGLHHSYRIDIAASRKRTADIASELGLRLIPVGSREAELALDAYQTYGKDRHPAALNFGDCFAYACAKANDARLLYKGDDFAMTDLA